MSCTVLLPAAVHFKKIHKAFGFKTINDKQCRLLNVFAKQKTLSGTNVRVQGKHLMLLRINPQ
jgi:hypothetical protein